MFSHFFIDRPIFASVISIVIVLVGLVAMMTLPIAQYPEITPPVVTVTATYTGADAETLANTVAAPIEQQINGVQNMPTAVCCCESCACRTSATMRSMSSTPARSPPRRPAS